MTDERANLASLFADCWKDEALKKRFMSNPKDVLAERGFATPEGVEVKVVENSDNCVHITLPATPQGVAEMSDADLGQAVGGAGFTQVGMMSCQQPSCVDHCVRTTPGSPGCPPA